MRPRGKLRYGAALLVGWFLMLTPLTQEWPWHRVSGAPLQHWYDKHDVPFATEHDCEVDKQRIILHAKNSSAMNDTYTLRLYYSFALQCVSSDDPRLQEK